MDEVVQDRARLDATMSEWENVDTTENCTDRGQRLRLHLKARFGTLRRAFKVLDLNGRGVISFNDFKHGLEKNDVRWVEVSGCNDLHQLFRSFDIQNNGNVNFTQMMGMSSHEASDDHEDWQYLTTMEKWTRWCSHTDTSAYKQHDELSCSRPADRPQPLRQAREDMNMIRMKREKKRDRDRARMRRMIAQGIHKTPSGLHLTASHLPKDIASEQYNAKKYRHDALEKVDLQSKRIQQAITYSTEARQQLKHCNEAMLGIQITSKKTEMAEFLLALRSDKPDGGGLCQTTKLSFDMVNMFNEEDLSPEERHVRCLARSLGMPIPDAEAVRAQYVACTKHAKGITWKKFPKMLRALCGGAYSDAQLPELWRTIDQEGKGYIGFDEYLVWHYYTCDAPNLGFHPPTPSTTSLSATPRENVMAQPPRTNQLNPELSETRYRHGKHLEVPEPFQMPRTVN